MGPSRAYMIRKMLSTYNCRSVFFGLHKGKNGFVDDGGLAPIRSIG